MAEPELRAEWRTAPHPDRFSPDDPGFETSMAAHNAAVERGEGGYFDPVTALFVMTAVTLAARPCCEQGCRHCPWLLDNCERDG